MCLEGGKQNYGEGKWIAPGEIAYFPEGTPYGPEQSNTERLSHHAAVRRREPVGLHQLGTRAKGHGRDEGVRHLREGHLQARRPARARREAQPGRLRGDLGARQQAQARLSEAALRRADPDEAGQFRMGAVRRTSRALPESSSASSPNAACNSRCSGSRPGARGLQLSRGGIQIGFVVQRRAARSTAQALRKHSAFSGREDFALTSDEGMEVLLVGLPIFAEQARQETLVAAE